MDNSLYKVFKTVDAQGISFSGLERGNRIRIPLEGQGEIEGNIRVVLLPENRRIELHITREVKVLKTESEEVMALDVGKETSCMRRERNTSVKARRRRRGIFGNITLEERRSERENAWRR
ncbi:MAG: hypothetical protein J2P21_28090 [Chloracidobacterium sp.]|nr:hypothetical protein [Chloracidobacterium sp.]